MGKIEIYQDKKDEWRFRVIAGNGEIIACSEGYKIRQDALNGIKSLKKNINSELVIVQRTHG